MRTYLAPLLLVISVVLGLVPVRADEPSLTPLNSYRRLTWDDYPIDDDAPGMSAQTRTFLGYSMQVRVRRSDGKFTAVVDKLTISGGMDRANSWRRSSVPTNAVQLLQHEQGHLTINEIKRRQMQQVPYSKLPVGTGSSSNAAYKDLQTRLRDWYQAHQRDLTETQNRYDRETVHGTRAAEQKAWTERLEETLSELPAQDQ